MGLMDETSYAMFGHDGVGNEGVFGRFCVFCNRGRDTWTGLGCYLRDRKGCLKDRELVFLLSESNFMTFNHASVPPTFSQPQLSG